MQAFNPIQSNKLYVQIYNQIYEAISNGVFKVGEKLPSEKDLCQMFNVSRVPVREALCALELNGMVDSIQGVGVYVNGIKSKDKDLAQEIEPQDLIHARIVLEPDIAKEAALNITSEEKENLIRIMQRFQQEAEADVYTNDTDKSFHMCVARASGNTMYVKIMDLFLAAMEQEMWDLILSRTIESSKYRKQNYSEHMDIANAILAGNSEEAFRRMKQHMENLPIRYWA